MNKCLVFFKEQTQLIALIVLLCFNLCHFNKKQLFQTIYHFMISIKFYTIYLEVVTQLTKCRNC